MDPCLEDYGGCDHPLRARCSFKKPKPIDMYQLPPICECVEPYKGNGTLCVLDTLDAVLRIPVLDNFVQWMQTKSSLTMSLNNTLSNTTLTSTFFVPVNTDVEGIDSSGLLVMNKTIKLTHRLLMEHSGNWTFVSANGALIEITLADDGKFLVNNISLVAMNIETVNGILHITESPIAIFEKSNTLASVGSSTSSIGTWVMIGVAVLVAVAVIVVVSVVLVKKSKSSGVFDVFKTSQKGSESNLSFARLSAHDDDDSSSSKSESGGAKYDNPIFDDPLYNENELLQL
jgi:hypothetical protein